MLGGPEHWDKDSDIGVDCLLPNGIFVTMICRKSNRISEIKLQLWEEAKRQPLFHLLRDPESYVFVYVTTRSKQVECVEETQRLNEIRPYKPIFKVVQREGDRTLSLLNSQISEVIGKTISELANVKSSEVNDFRLCMIERCRDAIAWRNAASWVELMRCHCPPDIVSEQHMEKLLENLKKMDPEMNQLGQFLIQVCYMHVGWVHTYVCMYVSCNCVCRCIHTCIHSRYMHTYVCMYVCTYIHMYVCNGVCCVCGVVCVCGGAVSWTILCPTDVVPRS